MFESILNWLLEQLGALAVYGTAGLLVGWNALPQPAWIKKLYDRLTGKKEEVEEKDKEQ